MNQNPECPDCDKRCGGVCQIAKPVVCPDGHITELDDCLRAEDVLQIEVMCDLADPDDLVCPEYFFISDMNQWVTCKHFVRDLPEPPDPDLGALHGVGTYLVHKYPSGGNIISYSGSRTCSWADTKYGDPTGERAFLQSVGDQNLED